MEYASKGVAGAGLGLGIAGTALGILNGGLSDGLFGNRKGHYDHGGHGHGHGHGHSGCGCNYPKYPLATQKDLDYVQMLAHKDAIIADKDAKLYTNAQVADLTAYVNKRFHEIEHRFCFDEKLIEKNKCEIEKTNIDLHSNYYKMHKSISPRDICPKVQLACEIEREIRHAEHSVSSHNPY